MRLKQSVIASAALACIACSASRPMAADTFGDGSPAVVHGRNAAIASILYESGTLGPTGMLHGAVAATNVNRFVILGARFQLVHPAVTTQVGGHFVSETGGTFFGAIVKLDGEHDFPNSNDLSTPDVLGAAKLTFPIASAEAYGNLALSLDAGWYALVFGSGLFDTVGAGAALRNNPDNGTQVYIVNEPNIGWSDLNIIAQPFKNHRFVVKGTVIPEPSTLAIAATGAFALTAIRRSGCKPRRRRA